MAYKVLNGFTYIEKLDHDILKKFPETLLVDENPTSESILFRLLQGTLDIKLNSQEEIVEQNICYNQIKDLFEENTVKDPISKWIDSSFGLKDINHYFKLSKRNKVLFDELLAEFSYFFICKSRSNNVSAFLHLYRALEFMSYSFPMIYSSMTSNFYASYDTFKGFFLSKDQGQLKFFEEFVRVLFEKFVLLRRTKIDTFVGDEILDTTKRKIIKLLCNNFEFFDDGYVISIEYKNMLDLIINLRNRYFHFQSDRRENISNINFNSELFFASLNDKFANWLSMIYLEILTHGVY